MRLHAVLVSLFVIYLAVGCSETDKKASEKGSLAELEKAMEEGSSTKGDKKKKEKEGDEGTSGAGALPPDGSQPPKKEEELPPDGDQKGNENELRPAGHQAPRGELPPPSKRQNVVGPPKVNLVLDRSRSLPIAFRGWKRQEIRPEAYERFVDRLDLMPSKPTVWLLPGETATLEKSDGLTSEFPMMTENIHTPLKAFIKDYWLGRRTELAGQTLILITDLKDEPVPEQSRLIGARELGRLIAVLLSGEAGAAAIPEEVRLTELWPPNFPAEKGAGEPEPPFVLTIVRHQNDAKMVAKLLVALTESATDEGWRVDEVVMDHLGSCVQSVGKDGATATLAASCLEIQMKTMTYRDDNADRERAAGLEYYEECPTVSMGHMQRALQNSGGSQVAFSVSANLKTEAESWRVKRLFLHDGSGVADKGDFRQPVCDCLLEWTGGQAVADAGQPNGFVADGVLNLKDGRNFKSFTGLDQVYLGSELVYSPTFKTSSEYLKGVGEEVLEGVKWFGEVSYVDKNSCKALYLKGQGAVATLRNLECDDCFDD